MKETGKKPSEKPTLQVHEWLAVAVIIGLMGMLTAISQLSSGSNATPQTGEPHFISDPYIEVIVEGDVENPGNFKVKKGTLVQDVLNEAKMLSTADPRSLKLKSKARKGQVIRVPRMETVTIYLEGLVEHPGAITVAKGTRLLDLLESVIFSPGADLEPLRKKRRLKDNETIKIKRKKATKVVAQS